MFDVNKWLKEAKSEALAKECGMFLIHNGVVRETAKRQVREGIESPKVNGMDFSYDREKLEAAIESAKKMPGIKIIKVWINEGRLGLGDDIMYVLVGGDIRPRVIDCLQALVGEIKNNCVTETEI